MSFCWLKVLGQSLEADSLPDVALLGEHAHSGEAGKLLQLLLGCAVHCAKRDGKKSLRKDSCTREFFFVGIVQLSLTGPCACVHAC